MDKLIIGANVRGKSYDKKFLNSIKNRGIRTAVTGYRDDEGRVVVLWGQQRVLAAVEAERPSVPVMIIPKPDDIDRIIDQVEENDKRTALTTAERVAAFEQLTAFGLSVAEIAKRTSRDKKEVDAAVRVAASPLAKGAVGRYEFLDVFQGDVVGEFADDKEAVKELVKTAKDGGPFAHVAQKLRDARTDKANRAAIEAELTEAGVKLMSEQDRRDSSLHRALGMLVDADRKELDPEAHRSCPGHAAYVEKGWTWITVPADQATDDDETEEATDAEPGMVRKEVYDWKVRHVCADWKKYGHQDCYASGPAKKKAADMSEPERTAERDKRRDVIQSNKDWTSATTVRLEWLTTFLTRKTPPKGTGVFVARSLGTSSLQLTDGYAMAYDLLGLKGSSSSSLPFYNAYPKAVGQASEARAQVLTLALVLAACEKQLTPKDSWRGTRSHLQDYLRFLASCGYPLADIERRACGETPKPVEPAAEATTEPAPAE